MYHKTMIATVLLAVLLGSSFSVYGMETAMDRQGNLKAIEEKIMFLKDDYLFLENEIQRLMKECI